MTNQTHAQEWINNGWGEYRYLLCYCGKCANQEILKVSLMQFAKLADKWGYDLTNKKSLEAFTCVVREKLSK